MLLQIESFQNSQKGCTQSNSIQNRFRKGCHLNSLFLSLDYHIDWFKHTKYTFSCQGWDVENNTKSARAPIMHSIQFLWNHVGPWPATPAESPSLQTGPILFSCVQLIGKAWLLAITNHLSNQGSWPSFFIQPCQSLAWWQTHLRLIQGLKYMFEI